jgi:hypothetical protein
LAKKHHNELIRWREGIAHFLDVEASLLNELFQRQNNVLRLAYAHALLLVHRPFLLSNFENLTRRDSNHKVNDAGTEANVGECLAAAMSIVAIVNDICEGGQMFRAFWVSGNIYSNLLIFVAHSRKHSSPNTMGSVQSLSSMCIPFSVTSTQTQHGAPTSKPRRNAKAR